MSINCATLGHLRISFLEFCPLIWNLDFWWTKLGQSLAAFSSLPTNSRCLLLRPLPRRR